MIDFLALVKALLSRYGGKQDRLADEIGVTQPTVSRWLKGAEIKGPNRDKIEKLARDLGLINHDQLSDEASANGSFSNAIAEIDLTAGLGGGGLAIVERTADKHGMTFAKEVVRDHWRLPDWLLNRMNAKARHLAAFPVQGDSMEPTLSDGDVIFVDTRHRAPSPDGIYALADEFGGVIVKRLEVTSRPGDEIVNVAIISDNARHRTRELTLPEIHIIGRYVGRFTT